jgi:redox-sensitive bicupin YhaK (pirin superfamily)
MIRIRKGSERGFFDHGWLRTHHTFSFGGYQDPRFMGYRSLRVLNDDRIAPSTGFPTHPHRDMEIISYVAEGALEHRDSMGHGSVIRPGELQRMTAGTGLTHSEFNPSESEETRLLQVWILPERQGLEPGYEQKRFDEAERAGRLRLVASRDGRDGSVTLHQDVSIYAARLGEGETVRHELAPGRAAWVQVVRGRLRLGDVALKDGDGAAVEEVAALELTGTIDAELLLLDLA